MTLEATWMNLNELVYKTIKMLESKGVRQAEAFFTATQSTEAAIVNSEIQTQNRADDSGVGFRVVLSGNKVGFACTNKLYKESISQAAEKAFAIAHVSPETPDFALPQVDRLPTVSGLFDSHIAEATVEDTVDLAKRAIKSAEELDKRVRAKSGRVIFESSRRGIVNTLGAAFEEQATREAIYLAGMGEQNGQVTGSCADFMFTRSLNTDSETIGKNVGKMAVEMLDPRPIESFEGTIVFGPEAVSYQLFDALVDAIKGDNVVSGSSAWTQKLGQTLASKDLTISDNARLEGGFSSRSFDDEGCPSQNTTLIKNGTLRNFIHHATSANSLHAKDTGNASRFVGGLDMVRSIVGNGYRAKPEIYPSNLIIQPGNKTRQQLVSEISKGVMVESMAGFTQPGSGLISSQLSRAFFVEGGEIQSPIKGGMITGVAFDWLKRISGLGKDVKRFQNSLVPSVRVEGVKVVGA
jgi:PmbA protein